MNAGDSTDFLYFIIKGKVQIMNLLEFVKGVDPFVERKFMVITLFYNRLQLLMAILTRVMN